MATNEDQAPIDQARDPSLEAVLELHAELLRDSIHVMLPGKIVAYDAGKQVASVQPLVKYRHLAEDGQTIVAEDLPVAQGCPVEFCGAARGRITWPVAAGDICELRFASASLARWAALAAGPTVDPGDDRRHDLSDAICFVGLHSPASAPTSAPTDAVVVHLGGGITLKLGSSGASHKILTDSDGSDLVTMLAYAIAQATSGGNAVAAATLTYFYNALTNGGTPPTPSAPGFIWPKGSSKVTADI